MATRPTDPLTLVEQEKVAALDPLIVPFALKHRQRVLERGIPYTFKVTTRSRAEQEAEHIARPDRAVPAGRSKHEIGMAWDGEGPRTPEEWTVYGDEAEALGLEWGGRYRIREPWHVAMPYTRAELQRFRALRLAGIAVAIGIGGLLLVKATRGKP